MSGDGILHSHETSYQVSPEDPPQRRLEVARNRLEGGAPGEAETLLATLQREDFAATEVAYHHVLAVLSGRPPSHVNPTELQHVEHALDCARRSDPDGWTGALDVIAMLMASVSRQETTRDVAQADLSDVLDTYTRLDDSRRVEISRHLDMLLDGAVRDRLDRINADRVAAGRVEGGREQRVWKFFEPDPTPPRPSRPYFHGHVDPNARTMAVVGVPGFFAALWLSAALGMPGGLTFLWLLVLVACAGSAWWFRSSDLAAAKRRTRLDSEYLPGRVGRGEARGYGSKPFRAGLRALAEAHLQSPELHEGVGNPKQWHETMSRVVEVLLARLFRTYGVSTAKSDTPREPDVAPATLAWLIRRHIERAARRFRTGTLFAYREVDTSEGAFFGLSVLGAAGATVALIMTVDMPVPAVIAFVAGVIAAAVGVHGAAEAMSERMAVAAEEADCDALHAEETARYEKWTRELAARPTDAEMARWLDFDKAYLKAIAMSDTGLSHRDLITHVVLTQGAPNAWRARVRHGLPRYSVYTVLVFLLTEGGVQVVEMDLDFETGAVLDKRPNAFGYEDLSSARVTEVSEGLAVNRAFRLSLDNGEVFTVLVENFDGLLDHRAEDRSSLVKLTEIASGVTRARQLFLKIKADKRGWVRHEREQRDRRRQDWARSLTRRPPAKPGR